MTWICGNISKLLNKEPNGYEALHKKNDDLITNETTTVKQWIADHPIDSHLTSMQTPDIQVYVSKLIESLKNLHISQDTIDDVCVHLREIAKQSERVRQHIIIKCKDLKWNKSLISEVKTSLSLVYTTHV